MLVEVEREEEQKEAGEVNSCFISFFNAKSLSE